MATVNTILIRVHPQSPTATCTQYQGLSSNYRISTTFFQLEKLQVQGLVRLFAAVRGYRWKVQQQNQHTSPTLGGYKGAIKVIHDNISDGKL